MPIQTCSKVSWLGSKRVILAIFSFLGFVNQYTLRNCVSVAMVCMVKQTTENTSIAWNVTEMESEQCNRGETMVLEDANEDGKLDWSKPIQGLALGSFYWGYIVTQVPGGWLASRIGGKRVFGYAIFVGAVLTLLMPVAARIHYAFFIVLRVIAGFFQGVCWPSMLAMMAFWAPPLERSMLIGFIFAGAQVGNVISFSVAGLLCKYGFDGGWPSIFYVFGPVAILWFIGWMFLVYDSPEQHPRITLEEKNYIQSSLEGQMRKHVSKSAMDWHSLCTSPAVWVSIVTHTCSAWMVLTFLTNLPSYMNEVLKFTISQNGLLTSVAYIGMTVMSVVIAITTDHLRSRRILTTTNVRKLNNILGMVIPSIVCISLGYIDCTQRVLAVTLLIFAITCFGFSYGGGIEINAADIAPKYSSVLYGISNSATCITGILAPVLVGFVTRDKTQAQWRIVFFISASISTFAALLFMLFGSGEVQKWAFEDKKEPEEDEHLKENVIKSNTGCNEKVSLNKDQNTTC